MTGVKLARVCVVGGVVIIFALAAATAAAGAFSPSSTADFVPQASPQPGEGTAGPAPSIGSAVPATSSSDDPVRPSLAPRQGGGAPAPSFAAPSSGAPVYNPCINPTDCRLPIKPAPNPFMGR